MSPDELRARLDHWANSDPRPSLAVLPPSCACENAASPEGSPGQVSDDETLLYFVTSTHSVDLSKGKDTIRRGSFRNVFTNGLSAIRLDHCDDSEVNRSASVVAQARKGRDGQYGGIVRLACVRCSAVRHAEGGHFCVYETPAEPIEGGFRRPCHADIASSSVVEDEAEKTAIMAVLFNAMISDGEVTSVFDFAGGLLAEHSPDCLKT